MDIVIDTSILRQDHLLRSHQFQVIFNYLQKTNSHLIIPTVVKQEMVAIFKRELVSKFNQLKNIATKIDNWCYDNTPRTDFHLDLDKEVSVYESFLNELTKGGGALELPYQDRWLGEIIYRLINRIKPANENGEGFRDVVIWLSLKQLLKELKELKKEAAFIARDYHFADKNSKELHADLKAELIAEDLDLKYFYSLDQFIQTQSRKIEFITNEWIGTNISREAIERVSAPVIERSERLWQRYAERKEFDWTGYIDFIGIVFIDLENFYVYDLGENTFYLHMSYHSDFEVELEFADSYADSYMERERSSGLKLFRAEAYLELECKIEDKHVHELNLESWDLV